MRKKLQSLGTRSAKRKLKKLAGRKTVRSGYTNHVIISKRMVQSKPQGIIVVEGLKISKKKKNGKKFTKLLGSWSYG